nr:reverse transcriptase domain-containing protein [Tanacetum cinerariifolium]
MNFGLKNDMIQQVQNCCQFHGLPGDDATKHLDKFLHVTQSIKVNGVTDDALRLYLFPHSLTHHATAWFDRLSRIPINTFEQMEKIFLGKYFPPSMPPLATLKMFMLREPTKEILTNRKFIKMNTASSLGSRTLPNNTITNPKEDLKGITTRNGTAYQGPTIPTTYSSLHPVVEHETEATKDTNKLSLPDLSPTCMTLELVNHLISHPVGVVKDVFIKVGTFHIPADFVVVDFDADPRIPLILKRYFLKTGRDLIDVFEGELTLHVGKEAITFNLNQTSRYSANYNDMMTNRIDVIDMACEEYLQEVLGVSNVIASGNPTPYYDPIVFTNSSTLTPFENSDFLLEEVDAFLALEDDHTSPRKPHSLVHTERLLTAACLLGYEMHRAYFREKILKRCEDTNLCLNWEKSHFMVKEGIVISHKISKNRIKVDKAKVDVISKLPHPTTIKGDHRKVQLSELNELHDQAYENSLIYKEKTKRIHYSKIKDRVFNISDRVLLFNSRLKIFSGKLKSRWSGPFTISYVFSYGTVELSQPDGPNFKVNGYRLRHYFGEDIPKVVVPDLQTFPKDQ